MVSEQGLSAVVVANREDEEIQACTAVLSTLGYRHQIVASIDDLSSEPDGFLIDLLLLDIDWLDCVPISGISHSLADGASILALIGQQASDRLDVYLNHGVDDFIVRPIHNAWLSKKIDLCKQTRQLHQVHQKNCRRLSDYRQQLTQEQAVVASLYENILRGNNLAAPGLRSTVLHESVVNGDILLVGRTPDNHLYALLGHFLECNISAAIAATLVAEIFFGMTAKGFQIDEIAEEINHKLYKLLPDDSCMAAVLVSLHPDAKKLRMLNCGFPEQILLKRNGRKKLKLFPDNNPPLGRQSKIDLSAYTCDVGGGDYLYLYSQALPDLKNSFDEAFGQQALIDCLLESGYDALLQRLHRHCACSGENGAPALVELLCDVDNAPWISDSNEQQYKRLESLSWKTVMEFDGAALRSLNPVPIMVNTLMEIQGLQQHRQTIFMIVTELFANALDHGVLKLDSAMKHSPEGFMRFYELREERLQSLQEGRIRLLFDHRPTATGGQLRIKVMDSGDGFDRQALDLDIGNNASFAGRGIPMLESLCSSVTYQGKGNRVTVVFDWAFSPTDSQRWQDAQ